MTRNEQREERDRHERMRVDRVREQRRVEQARLDAEYARTLRDRRTAREAEVQVEAVASRTRVDAILSDPASYRAGRPPSAPPTACERRPIPPDVPPVTYPSAPVELRAWQEHRHPEVMNILVEVLPLAGGGVQVGVDWEPRFGRALVTADDLPGRWQRHHRGSVEFPLELRRTAEGISLRWLPPAPTDGGQKESSADLVGPAATVTAAGWRTWRDRKRR